MRVSRRWTEGVRESAAAGAGEGAAEVGAGVGVGAVAADGGLFDEAG